jgi:hypothetical protein
LGLVFLPVAESFTTGMRTSCVLVAIWQSVKRIASAPWVAMMSSGSTPLPSDFDIFWPSPSWITAWMKTSRNGTGPVALASAHEVAVEHHHAETHSVMISRAVQSTVVGLKAASMCFMSRMPGVPGRLLGVGPAHGGHAARARRRTRCRGRRGPGKSPATRGAAMASSATRTHATRSHDRSCVAATLPRQALSHSPQRGVGTVGRRRSTPESDAMAPPELARDAPVADAIVPLLEGLGVALGVEVQGAVATRLP